MKLAFSTLGCPRLDYEDIVAGAIDLGYDGIEVRGIADELYAPRAKAFDDAHIANSIKMLGDKLEIPMLTTNAVIAIEGEEDAAMKEFNDYLELAKKLGTKYLRILCTNTAEPCGGDYKLALKTYKKMLKIAKGSGVTPLIETNGIFVDSELLRKFMKKAGKGAGVLWDIHHPYRYGKESIDKTVENIGEFVKYVHVKDSVSENGKTVYKMIGHGDLPIQDAIDALKAMEYDGYLTIEWVKRWNPDLEDSGIVFAHYINAIKDYIA